MAEHNLPTIAELPKRCVEAAAIQAVAARGLLEISATSGPNTYDVLLAAEVLAQLLIGLGENPAQGKREEQSHGSTAPFERAALLP